LILKRLARRAEKAEKPVEGAVPAMIPHLRAGAELLGSTPKPGMKAVKK
jgi:hypothetical protein